MTEKQQKAAAREFSLKWEGRGYEKGESQKFWMQLLSEVYGVEHVADFIEFEDQVMLDSTSFIDGYIPTTKVLIEQKSLDKDLWKAIRQSDGTFLTPFQQAKRYVSGLPLSRHPRWVVVSNFQEFLVYDMEQPNSQPEQVLLADLEKDYYRLKFLVDVKSEHLSREMEVSMQAGEIIGEIYEAMLKQYGERDPETLQQLNILCVRLVFCLYAEDAGIFTRDQFHDYLVKYDTEMMRTALLQLFDTLNTPVEERSKYLRADLQAFPYAKGVFADFIDIPQFTPELRELLLQKASLDFDWSEISPTIFGAMFESTLNPETRRSGGMHYTSIENIHKVIDPLFLNDLRQELDTILEEKIEKKRQRLLRAYQDKLASLTFLDPACGSGNFLTETYLCLRRLENQVVRAMTHGQAFIGLEEFSPIKVNINQFYGIEINDFAVTVATTALWISESQMLAETEQIIKHDIDFLPLKNNANIHEANALRIDWESVVPKDELDYIIGNPPFVGKKEQTRSQKEEIVSLFGPKVKGIGNLDYVAGWYIKAIKMMQYTNIKAAFVSTNSITQGEQVPILWKELYKNNLEIIFAYRTFRWDSEASDKAHVHCVIIGFVFGKSPIDKIIFDDKITKQAKEINPYLIDGAPIYIDKRVCPICNVPEISYGSMPIDDGHLILNEEDVQSLLKESTSNNQFIKQYAGGAELINKKLRWCLWLTGFNPKELRQSQIIMERVKLTREFRESSNRPQTLKLAETPYLFGEIRQPSSNMIVIPKVSSERRRYIPISFVSPEIIINGSALIVPDATRFDFGILISNVHMAWMRVVCGRMKSDYQYSGSVVYNNFPWPEVSDEQREKIAATAQAILDARALYPDSSLADLYDELTMPPELRKAHQQNDKAVMQAYGFPITMTESECVARLFELYQNLTGNKNN
ncbi:MAG: class I SAM-dependent DNA methyltransferase [Muribaculaceae bacterium]|nr:class I SAM-dependent DNA methyltransferase [Muribaculaceae bacterium]